MSSPAADRCRRRFAAVRETAASRPRTRTRRTRKGRAECSKHTGPLHFFEPRYHAGASSLVSCGLDRQRVKLVVAIADRRCSTRLARFEAQARETCRRSAADHRQREGGLDAVGRAGRNFMPDATGLASSWPAGGPKKLWTRALGEGHSTILVEGGASSRSTGRSDCCRPSAAARKKSSPRSMRRPARRSGSSSTPRRPPASISRRAPARTRRRSSSATACSRRAPARSCSRSTRTTGRLWSHDLMKEYGGPPPDRGYTCSPLLYRDTIIVTVGGRARRSPRSMQQTGALVWKNGTFEMSPASPILIDVDGQTQIVVFGGDQVAGMNPANGQTLWTRTAPDRLWPEHQHAVVVGGGSSAVHFVGLRHRQPRAGAAADGRATRPRPRSGPHRAAHPFRLGHPDRRSRVRVERRLRSGVPHRGRDEDRQVRVAGSELRARAAALCGRQTDPPRRGRQARPRDDVAAGIESAGARAGAREPLVDPADAGRHALYVRDRKNIAAFELGK